MPKSVAERVAELRRRQRAAGMISVSVVVPQGEARFFRELARTARSKHRPRRTRTSGVGIDEPRGLSSRQLRLARRWATETGLKLRLTKPGLTLPEVLARSLAHEIVRQGWPLGRNLGSVQDLQRRFGVGRNILREAIRKLESQSIIVVRRGANGGVFVTEPSLEAAAFSAGIYLEFHKIGSAHLRQARRGLQLLALEHCMDRLDRESRAALRAALHAERNLTRGAGTHDFQRLDMLIASVTGNPAFVLFMDLILRMYRFHYSAHAAEQPHVLGELREHHRALVFAILAGERGDARRAMGQYLDYVDQWLDKSK
jgi:DNA-binding FadR family transcriptional regulator